MVQGSILSATMYTLFTNEITLLYKIMGTKNFKVITGQDCNIGAGIDHIVINYVDDSTNIITHSDPLIL